MRVDAVLKRVKVRELDTSHRLYKPIEDILKSMRWRGYNDDYPILAYEREGGYTIFDGHHRACCAASCDIAEIPAWVVSAADIKQLLTMFDGIMPRAYRRLFHEIYVRGVAYAMLDCEDGKPFVESQYSHVCRQLSANAFETKAD